MEKCMYCKKSKELHRTDGACPLYRKGEAQGFGLTKFRVCNHVHAAGSDTFKSCISKACPICGDKYYPTLRLNGASAWKAE